MTKVMECYGPSHQPTRQFGTSSFKACHASVTDPALSPVHTVASTLGKRESSQSTVHRMVAGDTLYRSHTVGKAKKKRPRQVKAPYSTNHQLETAPNTSCIQVFKLWVKMQTRCRFIPYTGRPTMMQRILSTAMNDRRVERVVVR